MSDSSLNVASQFSSPAPPLVGGAGSEVTGESTGVIEPSLS